MLNLVHIIILICIFICRRRTGGEGRVELKEKADCAITMYRRTGGEGRVEMKEKAECAITMYKKNIYYNIIVRPTVT
jgi:hypothetical protein